MKKLLLICLLLGIVFISGCVQIQQKSTCQTDEDCKVDEKCVNSTCQALACGECQYLSYHTCLDYECCKNADCPSGKACVDHNCVVAMVVEKPYVPHGTQLANGTILFKESDLKIDERGLYEGVINIPIYFHADTGRVLFDFSCKDQQTGEDLTILKKIDGWEWNAYPGWARSGWGSCKTYVRSLNDVILNTGNYIGTMIMRARKKGEAMVEFRCNFCAGAPICSEFPSISWNCKLTIESEWQNITKVLPIIYTLS